MIFDQELLPTNLESTDLAREIVNEFVADFSQRLGVMRTSLENGEAQKFYNEAHSIKGAASSIGAYDLAAVAADYQHPAEVLPSLTRLEETFVQFKTALVQVDWMKDPVT